MAICFFSVKFDYIEKWDHTILIQENITLTNNKCASLPLRPNYHFAAYCVYVLLLHLICCYTMKHFYQILSSRQYHVLEWASDFYDLWFCLVADVDRYILHKSWIHEMQNLAISYDISYNTRCLLTWTHNNLELLIFRNQINISVSKDIKILLILRFL